MTEDRETTAYLRLNRLQKKMYILQVKNSAKVHLREVANHDNDPEAIKSHQRNYISDLATLYVLLSETLYHDFIAELEN